MSGLLIVIGGATATGKTALAIRVAQHLQTEIVSADSRQFYREMSIGTAKPTPEELAAVPHHFVNSLSVADDYSVGDFEKDALHVLEGIFQRSPYAVLTGGSGLFLRAVCEGLDQFPDVSEAVRMEVETLWQKEGLAGLQQALLRLDPLHYERIDQQNPARLRRAVEVCLQSGQAYSSFLNQGHKERPFTVLGLLLDLPRPVLYARIEARVDGMIAQGLEAEARALLPWRHRPALRTVGYEEFFDYFDGFTTREAAIEKIRQHSRNYAKRQATWFRKYGHWQMVAPDIAVEQLMQLPGFTGR